MKIIKDTKAQPDEQDDREEYLTTPSESVSDTIATKVTDGSPQMAEVSDGFAVAYQSFDEILLYNT